MPACGGHSSPHGNVFFTIGCADSSPRPQGRSSRERSELNHSRITEVKFCPGGQSEIRLTPGEITSCEPVKLLPPAAVMEFRSPLGCHSSSLPPPCGGGNFTIHIVDNFARATVREFHCPSGQFHVRACPHIFPFILCKPVESFTKRYTSIAFDK